VIQVYPEDPEDLHSLLDQVVPEIQIVPASRRVLDFRESLMILVCRTVRYFPLNLLHLELLDFQECRQLQQVRDYPQARMVQFLQ